VNECAAVGLPMLDRFGVPATRYVATDGGHVAYQVFGDAAVDAAGVDKLALIGDTEGGPMAMLFAATFPDRVSALVLINTFARWQRADDYPIGMPAKTTAKLVERWHQNWGVTSEILGLTAPSLAHRIRSLCRAAHPHGTAGRA
jgi:pimeloyl-ACP methyl ester carboxylesterase